MYAAGSRQAPTFCQRLGTLISHSSHRLSERAPHFGEVDVQEPLFLGVDSFSILLNHGSSQKPAVSPGLLMVSSKDGSLERMGKVPLDF